MSDLIRREDVLDAIQKRADEVDSVYSAFWEGLKIAQDIVEKVPSAEPERKWIPVTEALPENRNVVLVTVYWHETYQVMEASYFGSDWWCVPFNNCGKHMQKLNPIAWMPLPEPWRGKR